MGTYYRAIARESSSRARREFEVPEPDSPDVAAATAPSSLAPVPVPVFQDMPTALANDNAIRALSERLGAVAALDKPVRLFISGCRSQDGTSTVAAAFAIDLSQRLALHTVVIDAHLRHPMLHRMFAPDTGKVPQLILHGLLQLRSTGWPGLDLVSCCPATDEVTREEMLGEVDRVLNSYRVAVIDLGVSRLDSRALPLVRAEDPVLLVVRYGHTERRELTTTASAFRAANRSVAGVILNGASGLTSHRLGKLLGK